MAPDKLKNQKIVLGLDHGTSSVKATLLSESLEVIKEFAALPISTTQRDDVEFEQDPLQHLSHAKKHLSDSLQFLKNHNLSLSGIGLSLQRSGVTAWDKTTGAVLYPLIIWKDIRTKNFIESLPAEKRDKITRLTSLPILPYYAGTKFSYLQQLFPDAETLIGTLDSFLIHQLCSQRPFVSEPSMSARTMLYNIHNQSWDDSLCEIFNVEKSRLPKISKSITPMGSVNGTPLCASLGDQQAALLAQATDLMQPVLNLGTIASLIVPTGEQVVTRPGFVSSVLFSKEKTTHYLIEGISHASGNIIEYIENNLGIDHSKLNSICQTVESENCCWFYSAGGYATPLWISKESSLCSNETASSEEKAKALIENIGNFIVESIQELVATQLLSRRKTIICTGGLSEVDYLLHYIATLSGCDLCRVETKHGGAFGAAKAALDCLGAEIKSSSPITARFSADNISSAKAILSFSRWKELRDKALTR